MRNKIPKMRGAIRTRMLLLLCLLAGIAVWLGNAHIQSLLNRPIMFEGEGYSFEIAPGSGFSKLCYQFERDGVFPYPRLLSLYGRFSGDAKRVKAGEYRIDNGLSLYDVLDIVKSGKVVYREVILLEGQTFTALRKQLLDVPYLIHQTSELTNVEIMALVGDSQLHPEGQFYPDTYFFQKNDTDLDILRRAHNKLVKVLEDEWGKRNPNLPYKTAYEALIMASIIEKETGQPRERPDIAAVFVQRLNKKMRLQTDPTVIYGLGDRYQGNITRKHLREKTPYNTYRINGLPPTPIASAGHAAIHAALNPSKSEALYFVAKGDGSHQFSKSLSEHQAAVRRFQWKRKSNYRSAPQ